jgi:Restriction endonuclease NotI
MKNSKLAELFTTPILAENQDWSKISKDQNCLYIGKKCVKTRKSQPEISIGTCTVKYRNDNVIICPHRLLENRKIFIDCLHLLTLHEPGNELHVVSEVVIPGGSIDYILVSARDNKVKDFVGIELQTLDTSGTVWPERQRFLNSKNISVDKLDADSKRDFGINWKMTSKTILIQMHHKIETFENLNKHLVLVVQDCLLAYMQKEFSFSHISKNAKIGDSMHFHSYNLKEIEPNFNLNLIERLSTNSEGISKCLDLKAEKNIDLLKIIGTLELKISNKTLLKI